MLLVVDNGNAIFLPAIGGLSGNEENRSCFYLTSSTDERYIGAYRGEPLGLYYYSNYDGGSPIRPVFGEKAEEEPKDYEPLPKADFTSTSPPMTP